MGKRSPPQAVRNGGNCRAGEAGFDPLWRKRDVPQ